MLLPAPIQKNQSAQPDGQEGLRDMHILHAIYEAAIVQKSVAIRY